MGEANPASNCMEDLEQLFALGQISDSTFLRHRHRGLVAYAQPIDISDTQYQVLDSSQSSKLRHCLADVYAVILVVSLIS